MEALRRLHRPEGRIDLEVAARRVRLLPRALGLRQDHAAARHRRPRAADDGHDRDQAGRDISRAAAGASATSASCSSPTRCFPNLTVADNVGYGLVNRRKAARRDRGAASTSCWRWSACRSSGANIPAQLSGGQQQRVALARALATSPGLLLLDEPLSALDARVRVRLRQEISALQRRLGVTTIMVTHDQEEALAMADRIVVMNHGVIEQVGTPAEIYRAPATAFVADFVGKMNFLDGDGRRAGPGRGSARSISPAPTLDGFAPGTA